MAVLSDSPFADRDAPSPEFIAAMRRQYPVESETDQLLVRKLERRAGPPYTRITKDELKRCLNAMLGEVIKGDFSITDERWFTGGVSKIQLGFTLSYVDAAKGRVTERLVLRMDPSESMNTTSRLREYELLRAFDGTVPVPKVFWVDSEGKWFPEPALIYAFVPGVTKPTTTQTGSISGLGTNFGPEWRERLAPQFMDYLVRIHTFDHSRYQFKSLDRPEAGTTQSALWQVNRARRTWEEDRGEDFPLMEIAGNWLERNLPVTDRVSVVHGDYRSGNFLFDESSGRILAWLDWERGHLGDRHRDLAWSTQHFMGHYGEDGTYYVCGLIPEKEFFARYEDASGLPVDRKKLDFYRVLSCYQIIVSTMATAYRVVRLGKSHQDILLARVRSQVPLAARMMQQILSKLA